MNKLCSELEGVRKGLRWSGRLFLRKDVKGEGSKSCGNLGMQCFLHRE